MSEQKKNAVAEAKYGPMRKVVKVLGKTKTTRKVKLECGHTTHSRSATQRCRGCRKGAKVRNMKKAHAVKTTKKAAVKVVKKTPVKAVAPKREPVTTEKVVEAVASAMSHKRAYKK